MLIDTAKQTKNGKDVARALAMTEINVPVEYDGPRDITQMEKLPQYGEYRTVGIQGRRVMKMRPRFPVPWTVTVNAVLMEDILDFERVTHLVEKAGFIEGFCDGRIIGFGRFKGTVKKA